MGLSSAAGTQKRGQGSAVVLQALQPANVRFRHGGFTTQGLTILAC